MLADVWPTGDHAVELSGFKPGELIVIYGSGPVGLMAAYSAQLRGASRVMVVDRHPDWLALAESIGAIAINDRRGDHVERILDLTEGGRCRPRLRMRGVPVPRPCRPPHTERHHE